MNDSDRRTAARGGERRNCITLRPGARAPRHARRIVHQTCSGSPLPAALVDNAAFVAGELVMQSLRQARGTMRLQVSSASNEVTLRIHDETPMPPVGDGTSGGAERSWAVVRRLSTSFGYHCDGRTREMWALLRIPAADGGS